MKVWEYLCNEGNVRGFQTILAILIFLTTIYIAWIYSGQLTQMIEQNRSNREFFQQDQRPYVWNSAIHSTFDDSRGSIAATVYLIDFGKSPAINERSTGAILTGEDVLAQADKWFADRGDSGLGPQDSSPAIVPPGIPNDPTQTQIRADIRSGVLSLTKIKSVESTSDAVAIVLRIDYFDGSGKNFYRSDMCWTRRILAAESGPLTRRLVPCEKHNKID